MYKIICGSKVVDLLHVPKFIRFLPSGHIALTDKTSAQGVLGSDKETVYSFSQTTRPNTSVVTIEKISAEEFNRLESLLNSNKEIIEDDTAIVTARKVKLQQLSSICKAKITNGFNIILKDGNNYHFKLTVEDQLNLINLENQLNAGAATFIYHATDLPCQVFDREDMHAIIATFRKHTLYHTTYFNAVKQYISTLTDIDKIEAFSYGLDISSTVKNSIVYKILRDRRYFE